MNMTHATRTVLGRWRSSEVMRSFAISTAATCYIIFVMNLLQYTYTHPFNGPFSGTTRVGQYQKGKTNLDFTEARDSEWQWYQLGYVQVCTSLQTDNHASTPPLQFFYRPDALPAAQQCQSTEGAEPRKIVQTIYRPNGGKKICLCPTRFRFQRL